VTPLQKEADEVDLKAFRLIRCLTDLLDQAPQENKQYIDKLIRQIEISRIYGIRPLMDKKRREETE
jgi:hypothetical protein